MLATSIMVNKIAIFKNEAKLRGYRTLIFGHLDALLPEHVLQQLWDVVRFQGQGQCLPPYNYGSHSGTHERELGTTSTWTSSSRPNSG